MLRTLDYGKEFVIINLAPQYDQNQKRCHTQCAFLFTSVFSYFLSNSVVSPSSYTFLEHPLHPVPFSPPLLLPPSLILSPNSNSSSQPPLPPLPRTNQHFHKMTSQCQATFALWQVHKLNDNAAVTWNYSENSVAICCHRRAGYFFTFSADRETK